MGEENFEWGIGGNIGGWVEVNKGRLFGGGYGAGGGVGWGGGVG